MGPGRGWVPGGTSLRSFVRAAAQGAGKKLEMMELLFLFWWKRSCCYWPGIVPAAADKAMEKLHLQEELQREAREKLRVQSQFMTWVKNPTAWGHRCKGCQMMPNASACGFPKFKLLQLGYLLITRSPFLFLALI